MPDALANRAGQHVVGPAAGSRLDVRRDVGRDDASIAPLAHHRPGAFPAGDGRRTRRIPVAFRVTDEALQQVLGQVPPALDPGRTRLEVRSVNGRARG